MRFRFGEFELDRGRRLLLKRGRPVEIGQHSLDLLLYLIEHRARVVPRAELQRALWGGRKLGSSTIPTAINSLRGALGDSAKDSHWIQAVYGKGYRWLSSVIEAESCEIAIEADSGARGFVGRSAELKRLESLASLDLEESVTAFVIGEAGMGKTRLLDELAFRVRRRGCRVASGRCSEVPGAPPLLPWLQIFRSLGLESQWDCALSRGDHRHMESPENADASRFAFFDSLSLELSDVARSAPLFVLLDDLHCADQSTVFLFEALAASLGTPGVCFVAAYRPEELAFLGSDLAGRIAGIRPARHVRLCGLALDEIRDLLIQLGVSNPSEAALNALSQRTLGNPFFVEQFARRLAADGEEVLHSSAKWLVPSAEALLRSRFDQLGSAGSMALRAAAVIGREFELGLLRRLLGKTEQDALRDLAEAVESGIVVQVGASMKFRFQHVLLRDVVYESLDVAERSRLHRRVALALRETHGVLIGETACEAARHGLAAADPGDSSEWLQILVEASRWSAENFGFEEAAGYLEDAVDLLDRAGESDPLTRADILVRLGSALRRAGRVLDAARACKRAAGLARVGRDGRLQAEAALGYAPGFFAIETGVVDNYLIALLEEARAAVSDSDPGLQSRLSSQLAVALYWSDRHGECVELAERAVSLAHASADAGTVVFAMTAREVASWGPGRANERADVAEAAIRFAEGVGDREMELVYRLYRLTSLLQRGRFESVARELQVFSERAVASVHASALWYRDLFGALKAMMSGDWYSAEKLSDQFFDLGSRVGDRNAEHCAVIHEAYRQIECGSFESAREIVRAQAKRYPRVLSYQCGEAYLAASLGQDAEARRLLSRFVGPEGVTLPKTIEWLIGAALLSEAAVQINDRVRAGRLFEELSAYEDDFVVVVFSVAVWRPVSYFLGRLAMVVGELEESDRLFTKAARQAEAAGAPPWLAHIRLGHAELLRKRAGPGDGRRARELALGAEELAQELAMKPLLSRARTFLWGNRATA